MSDRCRAKITYGSVWRVGREWCAAKARPGEEFCGIHLQQKQRREEARKSRQYQDSKRD